MMSVIGPDGDVTGVVYDVLLAAVLLATCGDGCAGDIQVSGLEELLGGDGARMAMNGPSGGLFEREGGKMRRPICKARVATASATNTHTIVRSQLRRTMNAVLLTERTVHRLDRLDNPNAALWSTLQLLGSGWGLLGGCEPPEHQLGLVETFGLSPSGSGGIPGVSRADAREWVAFYRRRGETDGLMSE